MIKTLKNARKRRHIRVRKTISGSPTTPRLAVFRSNRNVVAQLIDDLNGVTIASASTQEKEFTAKSANVEAATKVGELVAERAIAKGIEKVVFDRGGYKYHGKVAAVADGARKKGLKF
jgi:large subunit ribosomal protein L18